MYKLFLIDYSMPDIDGLQLVKLLIELIGKHGLPQPIYCCCTAYSSKEHVEIAINAGFNVYLQKPSNMKDLKDLIARAFD